MGALESRLLPPESENTAEEASTIAIDGQAVPHWVENVPSEIFLAILKYCDWRSVRRVLLLSRSTYRILEEDTSWQTLCLALRGHRSVYVPPVCTAASWKEQFEDLWRQSSAARARSNAALNENADVNANNHDNTDEPQQIHKIFVSARVRPQRSDVETGESTVNSDGSAVTVPLHQKLQMIKRAKNCSTSDARKLLWAAPDADEANKDKPRAWDPWMTSVLPEDATDGGKAANKENLRFKHAKQFSKAEAGIVAIRDNQVVICAPSAGIREYNLDSILSPTASQLKLYETSGRAIVTNFLNGINSTVIMFGQTGSGKTYSMFGPNADASASVGGELNPQRGIVPRAFEDIMSHIKFCKLAERKVELKLAYVEVHGNDITNLLAPDESIGAWHGVAARAVLDGQASVPIETPEDVVGMLRLGEQNKKKAATAMNDRSSRAHSVLTIDLVQHDPETGAALSSKLCLADLGGSEQLKKSKAEGDRHAEAVEINMGLLALKQCISALNRGQSYVPYTSSTLTSLLRGALGGNSKTAIIVTCSSDSDHATETMQALNFGQKCRRVENETAMTLSGGTAAIDAIDAQLRDLEEQIRKAERWENRLLVREDADGPETYITSVLVGGEKIRAKYEEVLATKQRLVGL